MGIYDRDYYQNEPRGFNLRSPSTMVGWIILINVVVFVADGLFTPSDKFTPPDTFTIHGIMSCTPQTLLRPLMWWQFLTSGFAHAPYPTVAHILANMLQLWFLGRMVEQKYGSGEFLRFYLLAIVLGSVIWSAMGLAQGWPPTYQLLGASGAVSAVVFLFIVNYPRQTLLLMLVLPVPAWLVGVLLIAYNVLGHSSGEGGIAYEVHLVGIAFAALYYYRGWNLTRLTGGLSLDWLKRRPRLRVHDPSDDAKAEQIEAEVDRILKKISEQGEASLTRKERRTLEAASRQYQKNRRDGL